MRRSHPCAALRVVAAFLCVALPVASNARGIEAVRVASAAPYAVYTTEAAQRFRLPVAWIEAVLSTESAGQARAVSPAGAMGLMQVMPATWAGLRTRYGLGPDPFEPRDNILAGAAYLREMYDRYGDVSAMLAAYNAGPDRADDYLASGRPLPTETRAYVATIASALGAGPLVAGATPRVRTPDWREAPLFITRETDASDAATARTDGAANDALVAEDDGPAASRPGIFVTVSTDGSRR
jgi:hypothetical protein